MLNARDELEKFKFDHSDSLLQSSRVLITSSPFDAKNYIESARKLCRENPIVEELDEIIRKNSDPKHLTERYDSLIEPSALRLALEIYKMRTLDKIPWYNPFRTKARAEIYNFIGFMDLYFGFRCDEIYNLIEKYLTESIRLRADWYLPHENLGDLYSSLGRYDHGDKRTKLMRKSIIEHETALEKAKKELDNDLQELRTVQNRINISKALARLRVPDNTEMINIANKEINSIYIYYPTKYDYFANEVSARSLYNLACWYSLAKDYYENSDDAIKWSGICLAYALARDRFNSNKQSGYGDLWRHVDNDPDLEDIRCHLPPLDLLKFKLSIEISKNPAITENPVLFK